MIRSREELVEEAIQSQSELLRSIQRATSSEWIQLDLTMAQLKALLALSGDQPSTIGMLAQRLGIGLPAGSHIVDRLVRLGLAQRCEDPGDRRRTYVSLAPEGAKLIAGLQQGGRDCLRQWLTRLEDAELAKLCEGLRALVRVSGQ